MTLKLRIRGRLIGGFALLCALLAGIVGYTVHVVGDIGQIVDKLVRLRIPVAIDSTQINGQVYTTLASLRGYLLTGNVQAKTDRAEAWKELEANITKFDKEAQLFAIAEHKRKWAEAKELLAAFRVAQDKVEAIAFTPDAFPATKILQTEAGPIAQTLFNEISKMIDEEATLEASPERKLLLKTMADARGNFAAATAQLRMYLISGDKVDKERFSGPWDNFERAFKAIDARKEALTASQKAAFEQVARAHREFAPLPNKMFSIRESEQWNMPVHLLRTEAAPRAARILELLEGPKSADGTRLGGIKSDQQRLLREEAQTVVDSISFLMRLEWLLLAIGMAIATTIALLTARSIVNPVQGMTKAMTALAAGDLNVVVPAQDKKDEVGEMAKAVLVFQEAAIEKGRMEQQAEKQRLEAIAHERSMVSNSVGTGMARLAAKDLTFRLKEDLPEAYRKLQNDFNHAMDQLEAALQNVRGGTNTISSGSDEISTASNNLSRRTEQQAAALEQTTAALREITETVHKTAVGARQAQDVVASAKSDAEQSGQVVQQAINAMGKIEKSSQQIGQIIGVIDEIAFQTNLLALNAGVEAARAGDAGRGFAVVASEVRALAQRSADAAKQIKSLISTSALEVGEGVKLVGETGAALERIVTEVSEINAVITEIAKSAQDQATGLQQVNTAVTELDQATQQNAAMAEQSTAASKSLADEGEQLARLVNEFQLSGTKSAQLRTELMKAAPHAFRENAPRSPAARSKPASASPSLTGTQQRLKPRAVAAAGSSESWEEF